MTITPAHSALKIIDGCGLVTSGLELADHLEAAIESGKVERHATNRTPGV